MILNLSWLLRARLVTTTSSLALFAVTACGDAGMDLYEPEYVSDTTSYPYSDASTTNDFYPPPEKELVIQSPEAGKDFVFVASTELDSVAKINARTLEIQSVGVGDRPTQVRTRPTINTAAVLNLGSSDVTIIHASLDADDVIARVKIDRHLNTMVMSPTGQHVVIYFDEKVAEDGDTPGSFQLINVVRTVAGREIMASLPVDFHVRDVQFDESGNHAYIVTDDTLRVIDLDAVCDDPSSYDPADRTSLIDDAIAVPDDREVAITSDGRFAVVRSRTFAGLIMLRIGTTQRKTVELSAPPTDLDLRPDGSGALAVIRDTSELVLIGLPETFDDPTAIRVIQAPDTIPIGQAQLTADSCFAIVFSTAVPSATIGRLDMCSEELLTHRLGSGKLITGATLSPTGNWIFIAHEAELQSPDPVAKLNGFTLLQFDSDANEHRPFDKLFQTDAGTSGVVFTADDAHIFALVHDDADTVRQSVHVVLDSLYSSVEDLGSPPVLIGALPAADRVYIAQEHPVGRISFIDVLTGRIQTVTGFELNSRIK